MSLKAIELQVALPRTHDAGKIQEQFQQRSQVTNDLAALEMQKEVAKQEKSVVKHSQKDNVKLKKEDSDSNSQENEQQQEEKQKKNNEKPITHPYKGRAIDFSG